MASCRATFSPGRWPVRLVLLGALLAGVPPASARPSDEPMKPHGGISSVQAFDVRVQLKYRVRETSPKSTRVVDAESDWSGVIRPIPDNDACEWTGEMHVRASARGQSVSRGSHTHTYSFSAEGDDEQPFGLVFYDDGTYRFGFGYADVPGRQTLQCSAGKCEADPEVTAFYSHPVEMRLPIPKGVTSLSGTKDVASSDSPDHTFTVTWSFTPAGQAPVLKAVPKVAASVRRGEPLTLDGSASTGKIRDYAWTFSGARAAPDGSMPDLSAVLHGRTVQVTLLDGMQVKLTVTDGVRSDSRTVSVAVTPRTGFETKTSHVAEEGRLIAPAPMSGRKGWEGGENVCAHDPPASLDEPVHILHPETGGYTVGRVSDRGPYAGFSWVTEWKVEARRQTLLNRWIVEDAPPILAGMKSFYAANVELKTDVVAYLAAARRHERMHTTLVEKSIRAGDPAKVAEKTFGRDEARLRRDVDAKLKDAEKAAAQATRDPLPKIWTGKVAVPTPDTGKWVVVETDV